MKTSTINKYSVSVLVAAVIIAALTFYFNASLNRRPSYSFVPAQTASITQAVAADGTVVAAQEISLSFQSAGQISRVNVSDGDQVTQGQVLMQLNSQAASAALGQAQAGLEAAQANYSKILAGAYAPAVAVNQAAVVSAQTAVANASSTLAVTVAQQNTAVQNAYNTLLNTTFSAVPGSSNTDGVTATITGTYTGSQEGSYNISIYPTGGGLDFETSGLENSTGLARIQPVPLGSRGLYIQFSVAPAAADTWTVNIPNTYAAAYVTNYNAYQAALQTQNQSVTAAQSALASAESALEQAQAALNQTQEPARPQDVATAKAQVDAAAAAVQSAENNYSNSIIVAPIAGTITEVDGKIGQVASPGQEMVGLNSAANFQVQAYVSQGDLSKINVNDAAAVTLDAYGNNVVFPATILAIDPAATEINNVPSYKVTVQFSQSDDRIKSGMAAVAVITDISHSGAVVVPSFSVFTNGSQQFVLLKNSSGKIVQQPVQTGIVSLTGQTEITSGLTAGQQVVNLSQ